VGGGLCLWRTNEEYARLAVSGLAQVEDHKVVVEGIEWFLKRDHVAQIITT